MPFGEALAQIECPAPFSAGAFITILARPKCLIKGSGQSLRVKFSASGESEGEKELAEEQRETTTHFRIMAEKNKC